MASRVLSVKTKYMEFESHVGEIFDFAGMELSGKRVLIKPNILYYTEDEQARNTNPTMVEAVATATRATLSTSVRALPTGWRATMSTSASTWSLSG